MAASELSRYQANLQDEIDGVALYRALAEVETDPALAGIYGRLADAEERHAELWRGKIRDAGGTLGPEQPAWRTRVLIGLARRFGPALVLPTISGREEADRNKYAGQPDAKAAGLSSEEQSHARLFQAIAPEGSGGASGGMIAQFEGRHRASGGNALRAAVLGANDGLVSNASLVMGVAGADLAGRNILITGLAGLLAGSLSMALGEWLSVQSARELYSHQIAIERDELEAAPEEEAEELALIYQSKGLAPERAQELANSIIRDQTAALDTLAREELGVDPSELGGSAWVAAITSFVLFSIGAIVPVFPYFFGGGTSAVIVSVILSVIALFVIGAAITVITGRSVLMSGGRQVVFGMAAAAITFGVGRLIGGV
ncbi:MAG TPA: VIT1/CCC1 family protein [Thermomicrobiales bacterium]|jgi:VIT1/CCC1 family predicted Fe2+/Mn2+ transporter|nr:VIT1/CCC1 family protein [Thermomicrobiales bacterium]